MPRMINVPSVGQTADSYGNKCLLNVDGNYYSKSKRKHSPSRNNHAAKACKNRKKTQ